MLVGAPSYSSKFRAWFSEGEDQPHLLVALDEVSRRLGGVIRAWRFDRMATAVNPVTGKTQGGGARWGSGPGSGFFLGRRLDPVRWCRRRRRRGAFHLIELDWCLLNPKGR